MNLRYDFLSRADYPALYRAFVEVFSDYFVDMTYMKEPDLLNRWIKNNVDFEASAGAFDGDRLVGFAVVGVDEWMGEPGAFDAGTGILRKYRGFGAAPALFDLILERLRRMGVRRFVLEVIQDNKPAVRTYKKVGFKISREFDCFRLELADARTEGLPSSNGLVIEPVNKDLLPVFRSFSDWRPSWECGFAALGRIPDTIHLFGARLGDEWAGFIAYYPALNWIMNPVVKRSVRRRGIATRLLDRALRNVPAGLTFTKSVNVDRSDEASKAWMRKTGFRVYTRQYEMILDL